MKMPEKIKKGLRCCASANHCNHCPYDGPCAQRLFQDTLTYIQQLESELEAVKRERDAAVKDLLNASLYDYALCKTCKKGKNGKCKPICTPRRDYEWRGVCQENTKVQK